MLVPVRALCRSSSRVPNAVKRMAIMTPVRRLSAGGLSSANSMAAMK
jgi:hypothetical protein